MSNFWDNVGRMFGGLSILGTVGEAFEQNDAANAQLKQIQLQSDQSTLQFQQRSLANYSNTQKIINSQLVTESSRGVALSSPSFNALQRHTFNVGMKEKRNLNTEESLQQEGFDFEKNQVNQKLKADYFGDLMSAGENAAMMFASL